MNAITEMIYFLFPLNKKPLKNYQKLNNVTQKKFQITYNDFETFSFLFNHKEMFYRL